MNKYTDNTHRSLQDLVSVNAWFSQDPKNDRRFTLHAGVTFTEERLGGGAETKITFKLSVKRCNIVFVPPKEASFAVDPASVRSPRPWSPKSVIMKEAVTTKAGLMGMLSLSPSSARAGMEATAGHHREKSKEIGSEQMISMYHEIWRRVRGNHAWTVDGRELDDLRLAGPVFDAEKEPRLTLIDKRTDKRRSKDSEKNIEPIATIQVSCLREDIDIYDIEFKKPEKQNTLLSKKNKENQLMVAREVLKEALLREGLLSGNIVSDPYAEMTICDVAITITDECA